MTGNQAGTNILKIASSDKKGLIHTITGILLSYDLNIISNGEYVEKDTNSFYMRTEFSGEFPKEKLLQALRAQLPDGSYIKLTVPVRKNIVILATKEIHCLGDLLVRKYSDELNANITAVISNYDHLQEFTTKFDIPYHFVSHEGISREEHEQKILAILDHYQPDLLILAKYMRVLTPAFTQRYPNRIINIHHSFLPAFIGAKPYEQAYKRGVKIIGATAHFVNQDLDEGPIISQNVIPVAHSQSASEMAQAGRDVEKIVLAKALKLVLEEKVFVSGNKTIIFD